ncbi:MAG: hypothetical protein QM736_05405 [Vicinamibacterales bacterium]
MAKQTRPARSTAATAPRKTSGPAAEAKLVSFARELGGLLGETQNRAEQWLEHRPGIIDRLTEVRETAARLLAQLGSEPAATGDGAASRTRASKTTAGNPAPAKKRAPARRTRDAAASASRATASATPRARKARQKKPTGA